MGIELNKGQLLATYDLETWWRSSSNQLFQIEGAAGTGKTTIIRYFIEKIGLDISDVLFVTYMGKAASQLIRKGLPARTIHSSCYDCIKVLMRDEEGKLVMDEKGKPRTRIDFRLKDKIPGHPKLIVVDEAYMVPEKQAVDLMSFGLPIIALGDSNQLPPVFGNAYFLNHVDVTLKEIMRQKEGDPIIYLSQQILKGHKLSPCLLGKSAVIERRYFTKAQLIDSDIIITASNKLRAAINNIFREQILSLKHLERPNVNEKIICRKNNWNRSINDNGEIFLTNGLLGYIENVDKSSYNGNACKIDFRPDFTPKPFHKLKISLPFLNTPVGENKEIFVGKDCNSFEYAYAITTHLSQGSEFPKVTILQEKNRMGDENYSKSLMYTAITRASDAVRIVI